MTAEIVQDDVRFPLLANEVAQIIEQAVERLGLEIDEAACVVCQVAADYARKEYGDEYLEQLAALVIERGTMPLPAEAQS